MLGKVEAITPDIVRMAEGPGTKNASGGMITKVRAARVLMAAGIPLTICHGRRNRVLLDHIAGKPVGTRFARDSQPHEITPKKLWIALGDSSRGVLQVDEGAKRALEQGGSSLLAVGLLSAAGAFEKGDVVDIVDEGGYLFARGKVGCSSDEAALACGRSQSELTANRLFSELAAHPLVHRDDLVLFE
jgi:glutamate 5-kinase